MRDHTKLRAVESADEIAMLVYRATEGLKIHLIEPEVVETENVLNDLIRALRDVL